MFQTYLPFALVHASAFATFNLYPFVAVNACFFLTLFVSCLPQYYVRNGPVPTMTMGADKTTDIHTISRAI